METSETPPLITLTPHQQEAVDWLVRAILADAPLVALRGLAGVGKSALIPHLRAALEARGIPTTIGAPTHRAAMILRQKGLQDADTLHSAALMPYFDADYRQAARWLGDNLPAHATDTSTAHADVEDLPWLVYEAVKPDLGRAHNLKRHGGRFKSQKLLTSLGISGGDHFTAFGPKICDGVLILDEASMVGTALLDTCQHAFQQIILVGDPGQLPPVKDTRVLDTVPGVELSEIHRQAQDSPIVQLAYRARSGEKFWQESLLRRSLASQDDTVSLVSQASARDFLTAPLIVWRNVARIQCTTAIRGMLGYPPQALIPGEPLVCRSQSQEDRALGFYNNGLYTITHCDPTHPRIVTVADALGDERTIQVHLEELDGTKIDPEAIPFRFGYCLTAHTAQGGEWPLVYISLPELRMYGGIQGKRGNEDDIRQWAYTAITRAKAQLRFLTHHTFLTEDDTMAKTQKTPPVESTETTPNSTPSASFLSMEDVDPFGGHPDHPVYAETSAEPSETATTQEPDDDLVDPAVPASLVEALAPAPPAHDVSTADPADKAPRIAQEPSTPPGGTPDWRKHEAQLWGFLSALQRPLREALLSELQTFGKNADTIITGLRQWVEHAGPANEHALSKFAQAVQGLQERGLALRQDPYVAIVKAQSPEGFLVTIEVKKADGAALTQALPQLLGWMKAQGYEACPAPVEALHA